jgi:hypothetical protein
MQHIFDADTALSYVHGTIYGSSLYPAAAALPVSCLPSPVIVHATFCM